MGIWSWKTSSDSLSNVHVCLRKSQNGNSFCSGSFLDTANISWFLTTKAAPQERSRRHPATLGVPHSPQQPFRGGHWAFWAAGTTAITMWLNTPVLALKSWSSVYWRWPFVWKWIARVTVIVKHGFPILWKFSLFFFVLQSTMSSTEYDQWQIYKIVWIWLC